MPEDENAVRRFVEHMAITLNEWGFPRMAARVLITLMAADEDALSASTLAERLNVSPAAISGAVRYLMQIGMIAREPAPGSRSDLYRLPSDTWYEVSLVKGRALVELANAASAGATALGGEATRGGARFEDMRDFFLFCQEELDGMVERWRALKAAR